MLKNYFIDLFGDKKLTVRRNDQRIKLTYFSCSALDGIDNTEIVGYTDLKLQHKKKKEPIGTLVFQTVPISSVYAEKSRPKTLKGYFHIGENRYVGIERSCFLFLLFPLLLAILLLLLFAFCGKEAVYENKFFL